MSNVFNKRARAPQFPQLRSMKRNPQFNPFARGGSVPGYFLGGLFESSPGTSTTSQTSQQTNQVTDPNYNALMANVLGRTNTLLNTSQFKPYLGPNGETNPMVGLTPQQQQGISAASGNVGNYQPFFNQASGTLGGAAGNFDPNAGKGYVNQAGQMQTGSQAASPFLGAGTQNFPSAMSQYMSPYTGQVVQGIQDASNRNFQQNTMRTINDTFSGGDAAQFGREQHGNAVGNAVFAKTQADNAAVANALESGYSTAGSLFGADQGRQIAAGQTAGGLANQGIQTQAGLGQTAAGIQGTNTQTGLGIAQGQTGLGAATQQGGINDVNALEQTGAVGQNTAQNQSNFNYNQFQQQQQYPWQVLQAAQGLGQGWQLPTQSNSQSYGQSTVQQPQGSPFGQIMGGALGAASLATPGAGGTSALGNIFGGIKGWFSADGGYLTPETQQAFGSGGMVPTIGQMRRRAQPMRLRGMMPTGMPGMPPMAGPPPNVAPQPNGQLPQRGQRTPYAEGGRVEFERHMPTDSYLDDVFRHRMSPLGNAHTDQIMDMGSAENMAHDYDERQKTKRVASPNPFEPEPNHPTRFAYGGLFDEDEIPEPRPIGPSHGVVLPPQPALHMPQPMSPGSSSSKSGGIPGLSDIMGLLGGGGGGGGGDESGMLDPIGSIMGSGGSGTGGTGSDIFGSIMKYAPLAMMLMANKGGQVPSYAGGGLIDPLQAEIDRRNRPEPDLQAEIDRRNREGNIVLGGQAPRRRFADGGMFLNASEGLDDRLANEDPRMEMMRRPSPFSTPDEDMGPTGIDRELREDPLEAMWRRVPPHIREALKFGRELMPDKAIESYLDSSRDAGRGLMSGHPFDAASSGAEGALSMMGMAAPGFGRAAGRAMNPFVRALLESGGR